LRGDRTSSFVLMVEIRICGVSACRGTVSADRASYQSRPGIGAAKHRSEPLEVYE
jgi:hypothetical protein